MHIQLSQVNAKKMLKASGKLDRSVNEIVNALVDAVDLVELTETIKIEIKKVEPKTVKTINSVRRKNWVNDY